MTSTATDRKAGLNDVDKSEFKGKTVFVRSDLNVPLKVRLADFNVVKLTMKSWNQPFTAQETTDFGRKQLVLFKFCDAVVIRSLSSKLILIKSSS